MGPGAGPQPELGARLPGQSGPSVVRLFFAIELPAEVQSSLGRLCPPGSGGAYRWVDPGLLHVTLVFLGEQPRDRLPRLETIARMAAGASQPATLRIGQAGSFGGHGAPRVLWVGLGGETASLLALQGRLDGALRQDGFLLEQRVYRPHITLARRRTAATPSAGPPPWPPRQIEPLAFAMDALVLFESRLSPKGPSYTPVFRVPLGAESA